MKFDTSLLNKIFAAFLLAMPLAVLAQTAPAPKNPLVTPGIDTRQANQEQRIQQGVQSGSLTQQEAARMEKGQARVQNMEDKARADGKVTAKERERIQQAQGDQSRRVAHQKHDRQHDLNHNGKVDRPNRGAKH